MESVSPEFIAIISVGVTLLSTVLVLAGLLYAMLRHFHGDVGRRLDETNKRIDETNSRIDETNGRMDRRFAKVDEQFAKVDRQFGRVEESLADIRERLGWIEGTLNKHREPARDTVADG